MHFSSALLLLSSGALLPLASAVSQTSPPPVTPSPDQPIVPFTSKLPACATACGPLWNVEGTCLLPANINNKQNCFCTSTTLTPMLQSTAEVQSICGPQSCQDTNDLQTIQNWFKSYCNVKAVAPPTPTTTEAASPTSTPTEVSKPPGNQTWIQSHYGWVIFLVVVTVAIVAGWILASYFRRRYLRRKEREFEMRPPVALGPHQMQSMTGGFNNSQAALSAHGSLISPSPHDLKPTEVGVTPLAPLSDTGRGNRQSRGWLMKSRP